MVCSCQRKVINYLGSSFTKVKLTDTFSLKNSTKITSNDFIAGNVRVLNFICLSCGYICLKIYHAKIFFSSNESHCNIQCWLSTKIIGKILGKLPRTTKIPLKENGMAAIPKYLKVWIFFVVVDIVCIDLFLLSMCILL